MREKDSGKDRCVAPDAVAKARTAILIKPVVRSVAATRRLATSLRRIGADEETVLKLTRPSGRRPVTG